mgnify:FL=1
MLAAPAALSTADACHARRRLRAFDLRPTRQRVLLSHLMFAGGPRHVTAEMLFEEAQASGEPLVMATVYNTLHQFVEAGMIRTLMGPGGRLWFDTTTADHHHFFVEGENRMIDVPAGAVDLSAIPAPPAGYRVLGVDVVIRLAPAQDSSA